MRRIFNYTLFFLLSLTIVLVMPKTIVKADACSYKEQAALNKEAKNIKKSYEFIEDDPLNYHFKIYISNISENLRLEIINDYDNRTLSVTNSNLADGVYTIETRVATRKVKYSINVSAINGNCAGKQLLKTSITTPRYNSYSTSYICEQVPNFKYCGKFVDTSTMTYSEFLEKGEKYKLDNTKTNESKKEGFFKTIANFIFKYKWAFIGGVTILIILSVFVILLRYKRVKKRGI